MFIAPSGPKSLTIDPQSVTRNSITLSWEAPGGSVGKYKVEYKKPDEGFQEFKELPGSCLTCKVTELTSGTEYQFRVAAVNSVGCGPYTDTVTQYTICKLTSVIWFSDC